jgi:hypothetical protein
MAGAGGHIGGLIAGEQHFGFSTNHPSRTGDDNPMLTAVMVHLQAEAMTGLHFNPLNFIAPTFFENGKGSPRTQFCCGHTTGSGDEGQGKIRDIYAGLYLSHDLFS